MLKLGSSERGRAPRIYVLGQKEPGLSSSFPSLLEHPSSGVQGPPLSSQPWGVPLCDATRTKN